MVIMEVLDQRPHGDWQVSLAVSNYRRDRILVKVEPIGADNQGDDGRGGGCVGFAEDLNDARRMFDVVSLTLALVAGEQPELVAWAELPEGGFIL